MTNSVLLRCVALIMLLITGGALGACSCGPNASHPCQRGAYIGGGGGIGLQ